MESDQDKPKKDDRTIAVHVWRSTDHRGVELFHATIGSGWWVATSTNSKTAINAVKKRYYQEQQGLG